MPTIVWFLLAFGIYLLGIMCGLGLMRGAARSDEFEAEVRAQHRGDGDEVRDSWLNR